MEVSPSAHAKPCVALGECPGPGTLQLSRPSMRDGAGIEVHVTQCVGRQPTSRVARRQGDRLAGAREKGPLVSHLVRVSHGVVRILTAVLRVNFAPARARQMLLYGIYRAQRDKHLRKLCGEFGCAGF